MLVVHEKENVCVCIYIYIKVEKKKEGLDYNIMQKRVDLFNKEKSRSH